MKKRTTYSNLKEIVYEFDEYDIKQLILSKVNLSDSDSKTMTFAFIYKVNSDLKGAVVRIQYDKKEPNKIEDKAGLDLIMETPVVFGLLRQGHIPTIEIMLKEGATWEEIGKEIGWCPETAKEHYGWYVKALEGNE